MKEALQQIVRLGGMDLSGEYEGGLRGVIQSMTDCARTALDEERPEDRPDLSDTRWAVNVLLETIAAKFEANDTLDIWRSDAASLVRSYKHKLGTPEDRLRAHCQSKGFALEAANNLISLIGEAGLSLGTSSDLGSERT